jgi:hypothetical protein
VQSIGVDLVAHVATLASTPGERAASLGRGVFIVVAVLAISAGTFFVAGFIVERLQPLLWICGVGGLLVLVGGWIAGSSATMGVGGWMIAWPLIIGFFGSLHNT